MQNINKNKPVTRYHGLNPAFNRAGTPAADSKARGVKRVPQNYFLAVHLVMEPGWRDLASQLLPSPQRSFLPNKLHPEGLTLGYFTHLCEEKGFRFFHLQGHFAVVAAAGPAAKQVSTT